MKYSETRRKVSGWLDMTEDYVVEVSYGRSWRPVFTTNELGDLRHYLMHAHAGRDPGARIRNNVTGRIQYFRVYRSRVTHPGYTGRRAVGLLKNGRDGRVGGVL